MKCTYRGLVVLPWLVAAAVNVCSALASVEAPAPSHDQIEADWLRQDTKRLTPAATTQDVTREQDAAGGVDGVKDGKWGFHTEHEKNPWWQVDLGQMTALGRIVLWNRCDGGFAARNGRIVVLLSADGKEYKPIYQHDGTVFLGFTDNKPLSVDLQSSTARFVRLALKGASYFHLDEVEVYPVGDAKNIALGKPASQSSVSQWSARHGKSSEPLRRELPVATVIARGLKLGASLKRLGATVDAELATLREIEAQWRKLAVFPLTPALSPGERESRRQSLREPEAPSFLPGRDRIPPLPKGEGRGEGEATVRQPESSNPADDSPTTEGRESLQRSLYFRAHWAVRQMALKNPLLNFDTVLFVKRAPTMFPHMSDQHYGWWSRGGGGIYLLKNFKSVTGTPSAAQNNTSLQRGAGGPERSPNRFNGFPAAPTPELVCLTADLPKGNFAGPDVSYDGRKLLFAYARFYPDLHKERNKANKANVPEDAFYHLFEMNRDGSGRRQLTHGKYDDFDPRWLPSGDILFLSTRKGLALQCNQAFSDSTRHADLPDSYVRCGGDNWRPVPVFTLHAMDGNGKNIRPLSAFENFEWTPSVASDGRILYTRWDYIDRFNGHFFSLWSANQDGTNPQLVYGNYTVKPQVKCEARSVPGSSKLVMTAGAHHSITGGSLCLLDRANGTEEETPLTRLTPEVCFPETGGWPEHYYANPWPLSEEYFLVAWADSKMPPHTFVTDQRNPANAMGIYLYDGFGNQELLYRDPEISSMHPLPVAPRPRPVTQAKVAEWNGAQEGRFLVQDVHRGLDGVTRGSVKQLRIIGVPPKVQPHMNNPVLGVSAEDPGKFVLGTVPVESDGSAHFRVPSGVPVFFQALDAEGLAVQTMRSLTYTMPGQTLACVGCHEHRDAAPPIAKFALAATRAPSRLTPGPSGSWPLRFDKLVQPALDQHCVECHRPDSRDAAAAMLDLTATNAYRLLLSFGAEDLKKLAFERDRSLVGQGTAANSKLWALLTKGAGHKEVKLDAESRNRLATWMDTYAQRVGHFSEEQEKQLAELRANLRGLLQEQPK